MITRCPWCETSFRVTEAHLRAADGAVRCGACLQVFRAAEHMLESDDDEQQEYDIRHEAELEGGYKYDLYSDDEAPEPDEPSRMDEPDDLDEPDDGAGHDDSHAGEAATAHSEGLKDTLEEEFDDASSRLGEHGLEQGFSHAIEVEPDPEELIGSVQGWTRRRTAWWLLGSLVLLLALAVQFAWMQKDTLARDARYRSCYETACAYLGCQVPAYRDIAALRTTSVAVRSHTDVDGALIFNALLRNDAPFRQKFPPLDLMFTDAHNKTVAARRFQPQEYLGGEMAGLKYIPARTEVRISLEIIDPGQNALGYSLTVPEDW